MAKIRSNMLLEGLSGKIGLTLVVQKNGIIRSRPKKSQKSRSAGQKKNNSLFSDAVAYFHKVESDPSLMALYRKKCRKGQRVYNRIISEYMRRKAG